jgi:queuine tRNA-ribosyltransferase
LPSRNARHGLLYTKDGTINIKNKKWEMDFSPIDISTGLWADEVYSKAYLRHLFKVQENLGMQIATLHNLTFFLSLMEQARNKIATGEFFAWKTSLIPMLTRRL